MPMNLKRYPPNWKEISLSVREAAGNKCQRCGVANGAVIFRSADCASWFDPAQDAYFEWPSGKPLPDWYEAEMKDKPTRIVLTVAHTGPNKHDKFDCSSLEALCQLCHLTEDRDDHIRNAAETRMRQRACGSLFDMQPRCGSSR